MAQDATSAARSVRRKLGRGLGSLLSSPVKIEIPTAPKSAAQQPIPPGHAVMIAEPAPSTILPELKAAGIHMLALDAIVPNPRQPRQAFDEQTLAALANSIRVSGVMQPIIVRPRRGPADAVGANSAHAASGGGFELIAGERRWRAAQRAGLHSIPAIVRELDDKTAAEFSLVENLQREDLNPVERAEAFQRLIDDFGLTHHEIAMQVGLDRSSVSNHLRINELDGATKDGLRSGALTLGHAKALLACASVERRAALAAEAVRRALSVRELERRVKEQGGEGAAIKAIPAAATTKRAPHLNDLQRKLSEHLGTKVQVRAGRTKGAGKLVIDFYSIDQFEDLMRRLQFESD